MNFHLSEGDQQIVETLRLKPMTVSELVDEMKVSANAVRQRLVRLMSGGLITRNKCGEEGRGRPCHEYLLTEDGHRTAGNNFPELAKALWQEIQAIEDDQVRQSVMAGAVRRLVDSFDGEVKGDTVEERLSSVQSFFDDRNIPIAVETGGDLTVLRVLECPYPDLEDKEHQFCEVEKQLFAKVIGAPVKLCQCRKDGDQCCSFQPE